MSKENELKDQFKAERKFYLSGGNVENVPGTDITVKEARESFQEAKKKQDDYFANRRREYLERKAKENPPSEDDKLTTIVTATVLKDLTPPAKLLPEIPSEAEESVEVKLIPDGDALGAMQKAELLGVAAENGINMAENLNKAEMVKILLEHRG